MAAVRPLSTLEDLEPSKGRFGKLRTSLSTAAHQAKGRGGSGFRRIGTVRSNTWIVIVYGTLLCATQLCLIWHPILGLGLSTFCLFLLTTGALVRESLRKLSISLAILPTVQIAHSAIITHNAFQSTTILYVMLLLLALIYRYMFTLDEPVEKSRLKLKGHLFGLPLMIIIGEGLGLIGYAFLRNHYAYTHISLPLICAACIVFAFAEEMFLRGLVQQQAARIVHPLLAAVLAAVIYIPLAISRTSLLTIGPAVAMGIMLAVVYHLKHNLLLSTAINAAAKLTYVGLVATFILR